MLNISMSKLMHHRNAKTITTTNIKFKDRMLFVIRTCNQTLSNHEASARDRLINEKLKHKTFVEMIRHLAKDETDLTF
jgi:hypothetical protein